MLFKVGHDLLQFLVVLFVFCGAFANSFYLRNRDVDVDEFGEEEEDAHPFYPLPRTLRTLYLLAFAGEMSSSSYVGWEATILLFVFIFIVNITMMNVLVSITIVHQTRGWGGRPDSLAFLIHVPDRHRMRLVRRVHGAVERDFSKVTPGCGYGHLDDVHDPWVSRWLGPKVGSETRVSKYMHRQLIYVPPIRFGRY